ncbi:hypothetical protein CYLTODRAFT_487988 [Cylindrobasidium torrendii FP15055 ss-10]|uniref:Cryptic loci regulator 2 N-terminal domain-containing protein n=1 Tax=Cylindrobasidium torrendii FP15055 ss-10 TaxID=1314674 RepID=A0A0D7BLU6_9AGAR|nr:hypothetical protein CYLTODRAFT_487988 [Cylindrobasidium torrendii FP15055 ss-10]
MRSIATHHELPENPIYLSVTDFSRADGQRSQWPTNTTEIVDGEGHVNFMKPVGIDEAPAIRWRKELACALAKHRGLPEGDSYVLDNWPEGYAFFDHHKGPKSKPRHDLYLYGCKGIGTNKFRSVREFIPHLVWLADGNEQLCICKYCAKMPQREVNARRPEILSSTHRPAIARLQRRHKVKGVLEKSGLTAVVKKVQPRLLPPSRAAGKAIVTDRVHELDTPDEKPPGCRRWFRRQELVWVVLRNPIMNGRGGCITTWPAYVRQVNMKPNAQPKQHAPDAPSTSQPVASGSALQPATTYDPAAPSWTVTQRTTYRVKFLSVSTMANIDEEQIIPYQAYDITDELSTHILDSLPTVASRIHIADADVDFDPQAADATWEDAIQPFMHSWDMGLEIARCWNLTDGWKRPVNPPAPAPPKPKPAPLPRLSVVDAINAAGRANDGLPSPEKQKEKEKVEQPTQMHFQGMWWGAERIWVNDLVRIKLPRRCLAPQGAPQIFACAGPGPKTRKQLLQAQQNPDEYGAGTRGLFMHISALYLVEMDVAGVLKQEGRASGMLYELVDDDWEDPQPTATTAVDASSEVPQPANLPPAPTGYKFRAILHPGTEMVFSLIVLAGRYYPHILTHPFIMPILLRQSFADPPEVLYALEGLASGIQNVSQPFKYKKSREDIWTDANVQSKNGMRAHKLRLEAKERGEDMDIVKHEMEEPMDVDS